MPLWARCFSRISRVFTLFRPPCAHGRVCRTGRSCPSFYAVRPARFFEKFSKIAGRPIGPALASGSSSKSFFADRQRKICVRATATSRTNSPANIPASQAKADANKADAASPFALLMEMASAKDPAKPARKDAKDSGDQPANDKPALKQNDGNQNGVKQDDNARAAQSA